MVIFTKTVDDIKDVYEIVKSCDLIGCNLIFDAANSNTFKKYEDYVKWALQVVENNIPSPFSVKYPSCFGLNVGSNYFTIRMPFNVGFGINVVKTKKSIMYEISIIFFTDERFIKDSEDYKFMIDNGWSIKERKFNK